MDSLGNTSTETALPSTSSPKSGLVATLSKNVAVSLARVVTTALVALVLPAYLTHHLPVETYGAWVLILQLGAFVSFLDFGVQTAVAKFVAEHEARGNEIEAGRFASAGFAIMTATGLLGIFLTCGLAWKVPLLFHKMPPALYHDVRISVILVGTSLSYTLMCSVFSAVFLGLQRYAIPMGIAIINKTSFSAAVLVAVMFHGSLAAMGAAVAAVNFLTASLQIFAWRRMASRIRVSLSLVDPRTLKQMMSYSLLLGIWTVGMLCVSGLDVTIVGHFDYRETGYYSIATLPTSFMLAIISASIGPMMPASSALSTRRSAEEMGGILARVTRYSTALLLLTGLPLIVYGLPILNLWVGPVYAQHSLGYLRILVFANIVRNLCAPYTAMVVATRKLKAATAAPILEAVVNLGSSVYLALHFGAIGVAIGTLLGSFTSVLLHFIISMRYTSQVLAISRSRLFLTGLLRPAILTIPSMVVLILESASNATFGISSILTWALGTLLLAWFGSLTSTERMSLMEFTRRRLMLSSS